MAFRMVTVNGIDGFVCISALQKMIRRGEERMAMLFALELAHTSKPCFTMLLNRLRVIAHEDIGLANPQAVMFVMQTCDTLANHYERDGWRIMIGNCVRILARSPKSREADHFMTACRHQLESQGLPVIPDCALDKHTGRGKQMGRGADHFITEGARLVPPQEGVDAYRDEAYAIWRGQAPGPDDEGQLDEATDPPRTEARGGRHLFE